MVNYDRFYLFTYLPHSFSNKVITYAKVLSFHLFSSFIKQLLSEYICQDMGIWSSCNNSCL